MPVFNVASTFACADVKTDPETGCRYDCGDRHDYQQCRQAFYLKKQTQNSQTTQTSPNLEMENLELEYKFQLVQKDSEIQQLQSKFQSLQNDNERLNVLYKNSIYTQHIIFYTAVPLILILVAGLLFLRRKSR